MRLYRHRPISRDQRHREKEHHQSRGAPVRSEIPLASVESLVLPVGGTPHQSRPDNPDRKNHDRSNPEAVGGEIPKLLLNDRIVLHDVRHAPRVNRMHSRRNRDRQHQNEKQEQHNRPARCLQNADDRNAPACFQTALQKHQPERPDCNRSPKNEREEIGIHRLLMSGVGKHANEPNDDRDDADHHRAPP